MTTEKEPKIKKESPEKPNEKVIEVANKVPKGMILVLQEWTPKTSYDFRISGQDVTPEELEHGKLLAPGEHCYVYSGYTESGTGTKKLVPKVIVNENGMIVAYNVEEFEKKLENLKGPEEKVKDAYYKLNYAIAPRNSRDWRVNIEAAKEALNLLNEFPVEWKKLKQRKEEEDSDYFDYFKKELEKFGLTLP